MRTLIYKRTHPGDPDAAGCFGIQDCMGRVRRCEFDAAIGIGGIWAEARRHRIAGKVKWIGIGARAGRINKRGPTLTFDHFVLYEEDGSDFHAVAPNLARRIYSTNVRVVMDKLNAIERAEVQRVLARARSAPPSRSRGIAGKRKVSPCRVCKRRRTRCGHDAVFVDRGC